MNFIYFFILTLFLISKPAHACFDPQTTEKRDLKGCAVVLSSGLELQSESGVKKLKFLEPLMFESLGDGRAEVRTKTGEIGHVDSSFVKIYLSNNSPYVEDFRASAVLASDLVANKDYRKPEIPSQLEAKVLVANKSHRSDLLSDIEKPNKIILRNNPVVPKNDELCEQIKPDSRELKSCVLGYLDLFNILNVHATHVEKGETWFFIGGRSHNYVDKDEVLLGWIRDSDTIVWLQRQAVYPRLSEKVKKIDTFSDPKRNKKDIQLIAVNDSNDSQEFISGKLPLIASVDDSYEAVAVMERSFKEKEKEKEKKELPVSTDQYRQQFWRLLERFKKREVLFVIDNTESMDRYREAVIKGINQFIQERSDRNTRYSFAFFGDEFLSVSDWKNWDDSYNWSSGVKSAMKNTKFFQFAQSNFLDWGEAPDNVKLKKVIKSQFDDPQNDKPEMGIAALNVAVKSADWNQKGSLRIVVYIGDDGELYNNNRFLFKNKKNKYVYSRKKSREHQKLIESTADILIDNNVFVLPINVSGNNIDDFNTGWRKEVEILRSEVKKSKNSGALVMSSGKAFQDNTLVDSTKELTYKSLLALFTIGDRLSAIESENLLDSEQEYVRKELDYLKKDLNKLNLPWGSFLDEIIESNGVGSAELLADFYSKNDTMRQIFLPKNNTDIFVAMTSIEYGVIYRSMDAVCRGMSDSNSLRTSFERVAIDLTQTLLGEDFDSANFVRGQREDGKSVKIKEFFGRLLALPADYFSVFGDRSVPEFISDIRQKSNEIEYKRIHKEVCLSSRLFQLIKDNEFATRKDFLGDYDDRKKLYIFKTKKKLKDFEWLWGPRNENDYTTNSFYYVPLEFFPRHI